MRKLCDGWNWQNMLKSIANILKEDKRLTYLLTISALIRILFSFSPLMNGEAYYARGVWDLQWSYFDQPPLFFWISGVFVKLFGYNNFALRISSILFFALTTLVLYQLTFEIFKSKRAAFLSALMFNISAVFTLSFAIFAQPDAIFIFFWLMSFYAIYKLFFPKIDVANLTQYRKSKYTCKWWLIFALSFGFGALSKYNIAFLGFGIFMYCVFNKEQRHWFYHYGPYLAIALVILIFAPVLYWNSQNDWISFVFQSARAGATETSLRWDWFFRSIGGQILWLLPWVWIPLVIQIFLLYRNRHQNKVYELIAWLSLPTIMFFTIVTLWSDLVYHFHWQTPGYLMLFIPLGAWLDSKVEHYGTIFYRSVTAISLITLGLFVLLVVHINTGFWTSYGPKWLALTFKQKNDPTIYCYSFDAVKEKFEEKGWLKDEKVFVGASIWWLSGLIDYSFKGEKDFMLITKEPRNYAFLLDPNKVLGKNCVLVSIENFMISNEDQVSPFFDKVELVDSTFIERYEDENELKLYFFYCTNFKKPAQALSEMPLYAQLHGLAPFELIMNKAVFNEDIWKKEEQSIYTSFEYKNEHFRPLNVVSDPKYSGKYCCVVDGKNDFSVGYKTVSAPLEKIDVSFMAMSMDSVDMTFVSQKGDWWEGTNLKDKVLPNGQWQRVHFELIVPKKQSANDTLALYFWNSKKLKSSLFIDDVEFQLICR